MRVRLLPMMVATLTTIAATTMVAACSSGGSSLATVPPRETSVPVTATVAPSSSADTTSTVGVVTSEVPPPPTDSSAPSAPIATTVLPETSDPAMTPTTIVDDGVARLSADGPWTLVDSAPGVTTPGLVYELMPKLWVFLPTVELPGDDSSLFVPTAADIPIIEAYLRARLVFFRATTQRPIDLDDPGWAEEYVDGGERFFSVLASRRDSGQSLDLDAGVVLRPYVTGDQRTDSDAIVFDCELDGAVWRYKDGTLGPESTPGVIRGGVAATLQRLDGKWMVERVADQSAGCL